MRLVLFDIDGTLITDRGAARDAFADALASVYGYRGELSRYDFSGRTDPQIARMVLRDAGWPAEDVDARLPELWDAYLAGLARNATPERVRTLPGIRRAGAWYLRNSLTSGVADAIHGYGDPSDIPLVGDWNGDGSDSFGVAR